MINNLIIFNLSKHFSSLVEEVMLNHFDVLTLCGTKLTNDIEKLYKLDNFNSFTNNVSRQSGGVAISLKNNFYGNFRHDLTLKDIETLFLEMPIETGNVYKRPNTDVYYFIEKNETILSVICEERKFCVITGDFNLDLLKSEVSLPTQDLVNLFQHRHFFNLINKPTRVTSTSATIIDDIWCNDPSKVVSSDIIYARASDHFPVIASFSVAHNRPGARVVKHTRLFNSANIDQFKVHLEDVCWNLACASSDPNTILGNFKSIFHACFNKCFPQVTIKTKEK